MADIAQIGFSVDTRDLEKANRQLDMLADQDTKVSRSNQNIAKSFSSAASKSSERMERMQRSINNDFDKIERAAQAAGNSIGKLDTPFDVMKLAASEAADSVSRSLKKISDRVERTRDKLSGLAAGAGKLRALGTGALAGGAAVGGIGAFALSQVRDLQNLSDTINATTRETQELLIAFERFRLDSSDVSDAINTLTDRANDAENGLQSFRDDFALVGLEVDDLRGKRPIELFDTFTDALARTENANKRQTAAVRILGDEVGNRLLPLLQRGSQAFDEIGQQAQENGRILSSQQVQAANDASVALSDLFGTITDKGIKAFSNIAPEIEATADALRRLINQSGELDLGQQASDLGQLAKQTASFTAPGIILEEYANGVLTVHSALEDFTGGNERSANAVTLMAGSITEAEGQVAALDDALGPLAKSQRDYNKAVNDNILIVKESKQEEEERNITAFELNETLKNSKETQEALTQANFEYTRSLQEMSGNLGPLNDISGLLAEAKETAEGLPETAERTGNAFEQAFGGLTPRAQETTALLDESAILMAELSKETEQYGEIAERVTDNVKSAFEDFFFDVLKDGELTFEKLGDQIETALLRGASQDITNQLFGGGGGGGFNFGGILDSIGGFFGGGGGEPSVGQAIADTRGVENAVSSAVQSPGVIDSITSSFSEGISSALGSLSPATVAAVGSQIGGAALGAISEGRLGRRDFIEGSFTSGAVSGAGFFGGALGGATTGVGFAEGIFGGQATQAGENLGALGGGIGNIIAPGIGSIVGGVVGSLVGGLEKLKSAGLRLGVEAGEIVGDFFRKVEEITFTGRNTVPRSAGELTDEVRNRLDKTFDRVKESINNFTGEFDSLNTAINRIDLDRRRLDLDDLDPQEQQKRIGQFFIKVLEGGIENAAANIDVDTSSGFENFFNSLIEAGPVAARAEEIRSQVAGIFTKGDEQRFETLEEALQGVEFATDVLTGSVFETSNETDRFRGQLDQLENQFLNTRARAEEFGLETDKLRQNFIDFRGEIISTSDLTIRQLKKLQGRVQDSDIGAGQLRGDIDEAIRARQEEATRSGGRIIREALGDLTTFDRVTRQLDGDLGADTRFQISEIAQSVTSRAASLREAQGELNEIFAKGTINADTYKQSLQFLADQFDQNQQEAKEQRQIEQRQQQLAEQREQKRLALNREFSNQLLELEGNALQARLNRFDRAAEQQIKQAEELGANVTLLQRVQERKRQNIIEDFQEQQRQQEVSSLEERLDVVKDKRDQILEAEREQAQEQIQRAINTRDAFRDIAGDLRDFQEGLLTSNLSALSPGEQFQAAETRFERVLSRARGGDQQALGQLQGVSQTFLEQAESQFGASTRFADVFERVQTGVASARRQAVTEAERAQQTVQLQREQLSQVQQTNNQLATLNQQIADLTDRLTQLQEQNNEQNEQIIDFQTSTNVVAGER